MFTNIPTTIQMRAVVLLLALGCALAPAADAKSFLLFGSQELELNETHYREALAGARGSAPSARLSRRALVGQGSGTGGRPGLPGEPCLAFNRWRNGEPHKR
jgi:hypothetical protein